MDEMKGKLVRQQSHTEPNSDVDILQPHSEAESRPSGPVFAGAAHGADRPETRAGAPCIPELIPRTEAGGGEVRRPGRASHTRCASELDDTGGSRGSATGRSGQGAEGLTHLSNL